MTVKYKGLDNDNPSDKPCSHSVMRRFLFILIVTAGGFLPRAVFAEKANYDDLISTHNVIIDINYSRMQVSGSMMDYVAKRHTFSVLSFMYGGNIRNQEILASNKIRMFPTYTGESARTSFQFLFTSFFSLGISIDSTVYKIHNTSLATGLPMTPHEEEIYTLFSLLPEFGDPFYHLYRYYALTHANVNFKPVLSPGLMFTLHLSPILGGITALRCCGQSGMDPYLFLEFSPTGKFLDGNITRYDVGAGIRLFPVSHVFFQFEGFYRGASHSRTVNNSSSSDSSSSSSSDSSSSSSSNNSSNDPPPPVRHIQAGGIRFGAGVVL